jgi:hypothetical protein
MKLSLTLWIETLWKFLQPETTDDVQHFSHDYDHAPNCVKQTKLFLQEVPQVRTHTDHIYLPFIYTGCLEI